MPLLALAGVLLDQWLGEPRRAHPLVGFGRAAQWLEHRLNRDREAGVRRQGRTVVVRAAGLLAWVAVVGAPVALAVFVVVALPWPFNWLVHALLLWFALGARSLSDHIAPIAEALGAGNLEQARALTARIVTRDTTQADETALSRAAIESTLENGNDAIFGALFWFAIAGGPGALAFRLANTLDAMWGYRTPRFFYFGWAAARLDDVANYLPARLTALSYAICSHTRSALHCWSTQAAAWDSPNAGPVMASGAGGLQLVCGGTARYHGVDEIRPVLGIGSAPRASDIGRALRLVRHAMWLWLAVMLIAASALAAAHSFAHPPVSAPPRASTQSLARLQGGSQLHSQTCSWLLHTLHHKIT
ncbi:adenosylcobinamide-phosphate synthase CbiB [Pararobbsia alpina]|uniref:Cobalamin biosynthesis protein CobD n=1 Tax=Pararobbsia alpina TaxID=621374 RepID=A0A6S7BJB7_9BURK|nr:adenosylcobinamide-phosphate synthase CbiB [Pararobbsia alpina]CAB3790494.1 Cobalamin biosynthesis protein CobD [Pararobbsia alpina]